MIVALEREIATASVLYQAQKRPESSTPLWSRTTPEHLFNPPRFPDHVSVRRSGMPSYTIEMLDEIALGQVISGASPDEAVVRVKALQFIGYRCDKRGLGDTAHLGVEHYGGWRDIEIVRGVVMEAPVKLDQHQAVIVDGDTPWKVSINKTVGLSHEDKGIKDWGEYAANRTRRIREAADGLRIERYYQFEELARLNACGRIGYSPRLMEPVDPIVENTGTIRAA